MWTKETGRYKELHMPIFDRVASMASKKGFFALKS